MKNFALPAIPISPRMVQLLLTPELKGTAIIMGLLSLLTFLATFIWETFLVF